MNKEKFIAWMNEQLSSKDKDIAYKIAQGWDESETICERGVYEKVVAEVEKGSFDNVLTDSVDLDSVGTKRKEEIK